MYHAVLPLQDRDLSSRLNTTSLPHPNEKCKALVQKDSALPLLSSLFSGRFYTAGDEKHLENMDLSTNGLWKMAPQWACELDDRHEIAWRHCDISPSGLWLRSRF